MARFVSIRGRDEDPGINEHFGSDAFGVFLRREVGAFAVIFERLVTS